MVNERNLSSPDLREKSHRTYETRYVFTQGLAISSTLTSGDSRNSTACSELRVQQGCTLSNVWSSHMKKQQRTHSPLGRSGLSRSTTVAHSFSVLNSKREQTRMATEPGRGPRPLDRGVHAPVECPSQRRRGNRCKSPFNGAHTCKLQHSQDDKNHLGRSSFLCGRSASLRGNAVEYSSTTLSVANMLSWERRNGATFNTHRPFTTNIWDITYANVLTLLRIANARKTRV